MIDRRTFSTLLAGAVAAPGLSWSADAKGEAVVRDVPQGAAELVVWQPFMKTPGGEMSREIAVPAGELRLAMSADLRSAPVRREGY